MARIAIGAGHGLKTSGKRCLKSLDPNETREWVLNDRVADEVIRLLVSAGHTVYRVDDPTGEVDVSLGERVRRVNSWKPDYYLSIHHNAGAAGGSAGGTVMFKYLGTSGITKTTQQAIYKHAIERGNLKGNRSNGTPDADFMVIRETNVPAGLIECGFMDSKIDIGYVLDPEWSKKIALGIAEGICEVFGGTINAFETPSTSTESKPAETKPLYRIRKTWDDVKSQIGAFSVLENAKKNCPSGYSVFDESGKAVYTNAASTSSEANSQLYRVRLTWADAKSQKGAYKNLDSAKAICDANPGYSVFNASGKVVYPVTTSTSSTLKDLGKVNITMQAYTNKWWPAVTNDNDWVGEADGKPIKYFAVKVDKGTIKGQVYTQKNGWLPALTFGNSYNLKDFNKGVLGDGSPIQAIKLDYNTPSGYKEQKIYYCVSDTSSKVFYPEQIEVQTGSGMDGYAGVKGVSIDKIMAHIE